jgi:hypothetical protein
MRGVVQQPVSATSNIAFSDYERMHTETHVEEFLPSPKWAMSDEKLRLVIAHRICMTAREKNVPTELEALRAIEARYLKAVSTSAEKCEQNRKHLETVQRLGGPLAFWTSLLYRRFRLGMNSRQLAAEFGTKPCAVRQQINRCCLIARSLFPEPDDHLPWHRTAGACSKRFIVRQRWLALPANVRRAAQLHRSDRPWPEILEAFGCKYKNQVKRALRKAGFYTPRPAGGYNRQKHVIDGSTNRRRFNHEQAHELWKSGMPISAIARRVGVSYTNVRRAVRLIENRKNNV